MNEAYSHNKTKKYKYYSFRNNKGCRDCIDCTNMTTVRRGDGYNVLCYYEITDFEFVLECDNESHQKQTMDDIQEKINTLMNLAKVV